MADPRPLPHPFFGRQFQHLFLAGWLAGVVLLGASLWLHHHGHGTLGWTAAIAFAAVLVAVLAWLHYRLHHVPCPVCASPTRTHRDGGRRRWLALCTACATDWDLGVGSKSTGMM